MKIKMKLILLFMLLYLIPSVTNGIISIYGEQIPFLTQLGPVVTMLLQLFIPMIIVLGLAFVMSNKITSPLKALADAADKVAHGDLSERVFINTDDEFGELADTFNDMAESLENHTKNLANSLVELKEETERANEAVEEVAISAQYMDCAANEVQRLVERIVKEGDFTLRFENPELVKCWEVKDCNKTDCPSYEKENQRCWHTVQEGNTFAHKLGCCQACEVYLQATPNRLYQLGEGFNHIMALLSEERNRKFSTTVGQASKQTEQYRTQLIHAMKMAASGELVTGMIPDLYHALKNISEHLKVTLGKITDKNGGLSPEDVKLITTTLTSDRNNSEYCKKIVTNALRFSLHDKTEVVSLDINELLEEILALAQPQLKMKKIALTKKLTPNLPKITGRGQDFQEVFINLILFSQQTMKNGGTIDVTTSVKALADSKSAIEVRFTDTGCGFTKEQLAKLFESVGTKQNNNLWLLISQEIVNAYSGKIDVTSETGKGTTFNITFPLREHSSLRLNLPFA